MCSQTMPTPKCCTTGHVEIRFHRALVTTVLWFAAHDSDYTFVFRWYESRLATWVQTSAHLMASEYHMQLALLRCDSEFCEHSQCAWRLRLSRG